MVIMCKLLASCNHLNKYLKKTIIHIFFFKNFVLIHKLRHFIHFAPVRFLLFNFCFFTWRKFRLSGYSGNGFPWNFSNKVRSTRQAGSGEITMNWLRLKSKSVCVCTYLLMFNYCEGGGTGGIGGGRSSVERLYYAVASVRRHYWNVRTHILEV